MKKKNNKGFTLIELMAVIIILAVIGLIIFPSAIESINNSKDKLYKEQVKRILNAADSWASSNDSKLPSDDGKAIIVTINELQEAGLLKMEDVKNPLKGNENMSQEIVIYYDKNYNQYVSGYCDDNYWNKYYDDASEYEIIKNKCEGNYVNEGNESIICKVVDVDTNGNVIGDVNGDGILDKRDVIMLSDIHMSLNDGEEYDAKLISIAYMDNDGDITLADTILLGRKVMAGLKGDVNEDGFIDSTDAELLENYYRYGDGTINIINADMDCNGKITSMDLVILSNLIRKF